MPLCRTPEGTTPSLWSMRFRELGAVPVRDMATVRSRRTMGVAQRSAGTIGAAARRSGGRGARTLATAIDRTTSGQAEWLRGAYIGPRAGRLLELVRPFPYLTGQMRDIRDR